MQLELEKVYSGFKIVKESFIKELNSTARMFLHEKSGARLFQLENDDDNKVFSISFRTPPPNSTGLAHILEHSVLCGSRKFPTKEPFVELAKGSLNTFLNAMTYSDKTMYPIASRNDKDFMNLMDVYLDAALYPNIYKIPEILMQEGWHYDIENKDDEIKYKGVVYNEMKGAFSAPESILMRRIQQSLFPDSPYGKESGGDPDNIPELTQEEFLDFHRKYYHPSNSYIFLYGNGNILDQLKFINDNYLKDFDTIQVNSAIPEQKSFSKIFEKTIEYPISPDDKEEDKTFLSLNFVTGKSTDRELYLGMEILEHLLLETPAAPLKRALIDAGIGKDVFGQFNNSIMQPIFSVVVKNSNVDRKEEFNKIVFDTLKGLVQNGIDKKLIEASINIKEFELREAESQGLPKGLVYNIRSMDSWLHDALPSIHLEYEPALEKVKSALTSRYFEDMIQKYLLGNNHASLLILKPAKGISEAREEMLREKLAEYKKTLSDNEVEKLIEQTKKLKTRQSTPDSQETLEIIPLLSLEDINKKAEALPQEEKECEGVKVLFHPIFTNRIVYFNLLFDTGAVEQKLLPYVGLLSDVLGKISTEKYSYEELSKEINIHTGGMSFDNDAYEENKDAEKYYPKFVVRSKALVDKMPQLIGLISEIIQKSVFDDRKRLKEIIQEVKSQLEMRVFDEGHGVASRRLFSYFSPSGQYVENLVGISYYKFIAAIEKDFSTRADEVIETLKVVREMVFNKNNLLISAVCDEKDYNSVEKLLPSAISILGSSRLGKACCSFDLNPLNEGLMTQGNVQYVAKGYNFIKLGHKYKGSLLVFRTIAGYDYLWNKIRVQGGAYGAFARISRNGNICFVSYRDPNLAETLNVYDRAYDYLKNFDAGEREITKYIIGTISRMDTPLTPAMKGEVAVSNYIRHVTQKDIQFEREEVLNTKADDIKNLSELVSDVCKQGYVCVLGNENKIKENKELFNNLVSVFE